eukprot:m.738596 g.738596  ORF g.738596 m.738596 type:complete len:1817 (-) comp58907_c0_seq2:70-5520(-)
MHPVGVKSVLEENSCVGLRILVSSAVTCVHNSHALKHPPCLRMFAHARTSSLNCSCCGPLVFQRAQPEPFPPVLMERLQGSIVSGCAYAADARDSSAHFLPASTRFEARTVTVYVSAPPDFDMERNALAERVFPRLAAQAREFALDLKIVDPGFGGLVTRFDSPVTQEFAVEQLSRLVQSSALTVFAAFTGQRTGEHYPPQTIPADEFELLAKNLKEQSERGLLQGWYVKDSSTTPPVYLQQTPAKYMADKLADEARCRDELKRIQVALHHAAKKCLNIPNRQKVYTSALGDLEIFEALRSKEQQLSIKPVWFKRTITDLANQKADGPYASYVDSTHPEIIADCEAALKDIDGRLKSVLPQNAQFNYNVEWAPKKGLDPDNAKHKVYLNQICQDLEYFIKQEMETHSRAKRVEPLVCDLLAHAAHAQKLRQGFVGRAEILKQLAAFLSSPSSQPLILHGPRSCGKSSILAQFALNAKQTNQKAVVVQRFLDVTSSSSRTRCLLAGIAAQVLRAYSARDPSVPDTLQAVTHTLDIAFRELPSDSQPLVILIDGVDHLSAADQKLFFDWVPAKLNASVKLIISAVSEDSSTGLQQLQAKLAAQSLSTAPFLPVPLLSVETRIDAIDAWAKLANKSFTGTQRAAIDGALKQCDSILFARIVFTLASRWSSATSSTETKVASNLSGVVKQWLSQLEEVHGKTVVSHAVQYLTACADGVADTELHEIFSLDDDLLDEMFGTSVLSVRRSSFVPWLSLKRDLQPFLSAALSAGVAVSKWSSVALAREIRQAYVQDEARRIHHALSEFFSGRWSDNQKKPFTEKATGRKNLADRFVLVQPSSFDDSMELCNGRRAIELPVHYAAIAEIDLLEDECLFDFQFLLSTISSHSVELALQHFTLPNATGTTTLVNEALQMAANCLLHDPKQLASQLIGRLNAFVANVNKSQASPAQKKIRRLLDQARQFGTGKATFLCLPMQACLTFPSAKPKYDVVSARQLISACASQSGNLIGLLALSGIVHVVEARTYKTVLFTELRASATSRLAFAANDKFLVSAHQNIQVISVNDGTCRQFGGGQQPYSVFGASSSDDLVAAATGDNIEVWNIESEALVASVAASHGVTNICFAHNWFLSAGVDHQIRVWDLGGQEVAAFPITTTPDRPMCHLGRNLVATVISLGGLNHIALYDVASNSLSCISDAHAVHSHERLLTAAQSPSGKFVACGTSEGLVHLYAVEEISLRLVETIAHYSHGFRTVVGTWFESDNAFVMVLADGQIRTVDLRSRPEAKPLPTNALHSNDVVSLALANTAGLGVTASKSAQTDLNDVVVWDLSSCAIKHQFAGGNIVPAVNIADDASFVVVGLDHKFRLHTLKSSETLEATSDSEESESEQPTGKRPVASRSPRKGHNAPITCIEITRESESDSWLIVTASEDKLIKVWNAATLAVLQTFRGHTKAVTHLSVVQAGRKVVSASADMTCKVWNFQSSEAEQSVTLDQSACTAITELDESRVILGNNMLWVWDYSSQLVSLSGSTLPIVQVKISDGRALSCGFLNDRSEVLLWDIASVTLISRLPEFRGKISVALVDGGLIIVALPYEIQLWDGSTGTYISAFTSDLRVTAFAVPPSSKNPPEEFYATFGNGSLTVLSLPVYAKSRAKKTGFSIFGQMGAPDLATLTSAKQNLKTSIIHRPALKEQARPDWMKKSTDNLGERHAALESRGLLSSSTTAPAAQSTSPLQAKKPPPVSPKPMLKKVATEPENTEPAEQKDPQPAVAAAAEPTGANAVPLAKSETVTMQSKGKGVQRAESVPAPDTDQPQAQPQKKSCCTIL